MRLIGTDFLCLFFVPGVFAFLLFVQRIVNACLWRSHRMVARVRLPEAEISQCQGEK
jgi:hypothetical protein